MSIVPPPTNEKDLSSPAWQNWFNQLQVTVGSTDTGSYESRIAAIEADYFSKAGGGITGAVTIGGELTCEEDVDFDQDLNVDGGLVVDLTSNLKGDVDCDSDLNVDGDAILKADLKHQGTEVGFFNITPVTQPAGASQAAVVLNTADGEIGGLTISDPPTQGEVQGLRDKCEELGDDVIALTTLVHALRTALVNIGIIKGSA